MILKRVIYFSVSLSRTPGSRQPSPSDEDLTKNMAVAAVTGGATTSNVGGGVVVVENMHTHPPSLLNHHPLALPIHPPHHPQHHQLNQLESIGHQFAEQIINLEQNAFDAHQAAVNQQQLNHHQLNHQATSIDSSNVVSFEVQVSGFLA